MTSQPNNRVTEVAAPKGSPTDRPRVSVILCTYNGGPLLRDSLLSILRQSMQSFEVLLMDDGSTDGSVDAIADLTADPRVVVYKQANAGKPVALNKALDVVRGDYYCLQDADDISHPDRLARQVAFLDAHPELAGVFAGYELLVDGVPMAPLLADRDAEECKQIVDRYRMPGHDPTAMYRLSMVGQIRFDPELRLGQGFDYILKVGERFPLCVLGESLYQYRVDLGSNTKRNPELRYQCVLKLRQNAQRRRGVAVTDWSDTMPRKEWGPRDRENNLSGHFVESVRWLLIKGQRGRAITTGLRGVLLKPTDPRYYKPLAAALLPKFLQKSLHRSGR